MDSLIPSVGSQLDSRFELRRTSSGAGVIVLKGEEWSLSTSTLAQDDNVGDAEIIQLRAEAAMLKLENAVLRAGQKTTTTASNGGAVSASSSSLAGPARAYRVSTLSLEERYEIIRSVGEECIQEEELRALLGKKAHPVCYDGFEPSGRMHIAQGILKAINVNKLTSAGCVFKFWVADWFALLNNKMGGDIKKIRTVGLYMVEVWKAAGMDMQNVEFLWASDEINGHSNEYWLRVMDIARRFNVARIVRCCTVMGRAESDDLSAAQIFYPAMQCADVFHLKADICQLGMDQRKVNMLAREYCDAADPKIKFKPVILSHHMLMGLKEGQEKMSKSDPDSAIFMEDTVEDVKRKIKRAYCPPEVTGNPCMNWIKHIVFGRMSSWTIKRSTENGGNTTYNSYDELAADYAALKVHPGDLKANLTETLNEFLAPVRAHFASGEPKRLLELVMKYRVTR